MSHMIYHLIYGQPLYRIVLIMAGMVFLWSLLNHLFVDKLQKKKLWKWINASSSMIGTLVILLVTLSSRAGSVSEAILIPFHSFYEARTNVEIYRSMLMNVFLFFPIGLALPFTLPEKGKWSCLYSIIFAFLLSTAIEYLQFRFQLGRTEADDVICNTLGCYIGTLSFRLSSFFNKINIFKSES